MFLREYEWESMFCYFFSKIIIWKVGGYEKYLLYNVKRLDLVLGVKFKVYIVI